LRRDASDGWVSLETTNSIKFVIVNKPTKPQG
jgi:hypothetical protein